jgi:hypothetical protein
MSAFIEAFEEIGGVNNLVELARCNQTEFYKIRGRLMPRKIHAYVRLRKEGLNMMSDS